MSLILDNVNSRLKYSVLCESYLAALVDGGSVLHERVDDAAAALAAGQVQWRVAFLLTNRIVGVQKMKRGDIKRTKRSCNSTTMGSIVILLSKNEV